MRSTIIVLAAVIHNGFWLISGQSQPIIFFFVFGAFFIGALLADVRADRRMGE